MKIAIIGAGITGLYLAWKLAERGEEVTVFEKRNKIGREACSGLFSERILEFVPQSQKLIQNEINSVLIYFPKSTLRVRFSKKFFVMSHSKLDNLAAELAWKAGAKIILNYPINSLLTLQNFSKKNLGERKNFNKIIGCDGANSIVRKWINLLPLEFRLGIQGFVSENDSNNYVETWPTENGFIWRIPRGGEIEYGILEKPKVARKLFDEFLIKNNLNLERINCAIVPQGLIIPKNPKITLCGDATGLTKPWSGGGVIWGLMAADLLLKNFPDFLKYQKEAKRFFLPKIIFSKVTTKMIYFFGFNLPWLIPKNVQIESDFLI